MFIDRQELKTKLLDRTIKTDGCWLFQGSSGRKGYCQIWLGTDWRNRKLFQVHRIAYYLYKGEIPNNYTIDHLCETHNCINPEHLEAVTRVENSKRYHRSHPKLYCHEGHKKAGNNLRVHPNGHKVCRTCQNSNRRRRYLIKKGTLKRNGTIRIYETM